MLAGIFTAEHLRCLLPLCPNIRHLGFGNNLNDVGINVIDAKTLVLAKQLFASELRSLWIYPNLVPGYPNDGVFYTEQKALPSPVLVW